MRDQLGIKEIVIFIGYVGSMGTAQERARRKMGEGEELNSLGKNRHKYEEYKRSQKG